MLQTKRVSLDVPQQTHQLLLIRGVPDPRQALPRQIPAPIHVTPPRFPRLVEPLVGRVGAEDEEQGEDGGREAEGERGDGEDRERGGEAVDLDVVVEDGDEDGHEGGEEDGRVQGGDDAGGEDCVEVAAVSEGGLVAVPFMVAVYFVAMHDCQWALLTIDSRVGSGRVGRSFSNVAGRKVTQGPNSLSLQVLQLAD